MLEKPQGEFLGHPKGLFVLFFAEMWERFSFYGMRALLVLYMVKALQYGDKYAQGTYAAYLAFVYATPLIGGMLADKLLGARRAIVLGGLLMVFGHFAMAFEHKVFFYGAMGLIIAGNGFFKPNISTIVGSLYEHKDPRRDSAFTIFYMGINLGAWLSPLVCGWIGERLGWHWGFTLAGVGMVFGLIVFVMGGRLLGAAGHPPRPDALRERSAIGIPKTWLVYLGVIAFVPLAAYLLTFPDYIEKGVLHYLGPVVGLYLIFEIIRCKPHERGGMIVIVVLVLFSVLFWACFEQAGSSLTLFAERETNRVIFDWEVPVTWFQSINPAVIMTLGIVFSWLWIRLGRINKDPSSPFKFALGLIQMGAGFVAMVVAAQQASATGKAAMGWLILAYFLHSTGELCLSPVGLSTVTRLAPQRLVGLMMGVWFLSNAFAGALSGVIAKTTTESGYEPTYRMIVYYACSAGVLLLILTPLLKRLERGPKRPL